jgi:hypothetical protein
VRWGYFYRAGRKKSAPLLEQELSHCGIFSQSDSPIVSVLRFGASPKKLQEMSANCPIRLISRD